MSQTRLLRRELSLHVCQENNKKKKGIYHLLDSCFYLSPGQNFSDIFQEEFIAASSVLALAEYLCMKYITLWYLRGTLPVYSTQCPQGTAHHRFHCFKLEFLKRRCKEFSNQGADGQWVWAVRTPLERVSQGQKAESAAVTEREENRQKKKIFFLRRNASKPQAGCFIYYIKE